MRWTCFAASFTLAAALAGSAVSQTPPESPVAGAINPGATPTATPAAAPEFQIAEGMVALVNDELITSYQLRQQMLMIIAMTQVQPTAENIPAIQRQALNSLIDERLQMQELARFELVVEDEAVEEELTAMAADAGVTLPGYFELLETGGIRPDTIRQQVRTRIGWRRLVQGRYAPRARIGRTQVEQTLQRIAEAATKPQYLVGEIYIDAARVGGMDAAMAGANQLVEQMIQGAPFQAVARQFSAAPSAANGGDAGWLISGEVPPPLQTAFDNMNPGQLSRPIPVEGGVWIVYMREKRQGASSELVRLKQMMVEAPVSAPEAEVLAAGGALQALRSTLTCDNIEQVAAGRPGLLASDLGEARPDDLAPQFQDIARTGEVGSISEPVRTPLGVHLIAVCGRRAGGVDLPTAEEVENRLFGQQLSMLERRYIRDLREDSTIEVR